MCISLQCRRFLGGRNLFRVRIVVAAIFNFMTVGKCEGEKRRAGNRPISFSLRKVSTWRFRERKHLRARRKRLHCRLRVLVYFARYTIVEEN